MAKREDNAVRELRLEGAGLFVIVAFLGASLVGAFFLGRWYERSSGEPIAQFASDPIENVVDAEGLETAPVEPAESVELEAGQFDRVDNEVQAEPSRQAVDTTPEKRPEPEPEPEKPAPAVTSNATGGSHYVQIAALRDQGSAEKVVTELQNMGYPVRLFSEDEGSGRLYRVRVGGYATRDEASKAAAELKTKGHPGAFPTKVD